MQAGLLNRKISIYKVDIDTNEFGEQVLRYYKILETRALVINGTGNREVTNNEVIHAYTKTFRIRRYIKVEENYIIEYQDKKYRILSIDDNIKFNEKNILTELINE